jgi:hypothetical protein
MTDQPTNGQPTNGHPLTPTPNIRAWLGPAGLHATDHQVGNIEDAFRGAAERWPHPEDADLRRAALEGAAHIALGDERLTAIVARWHRLQREEIRARAALEGAVYAASLNHEHPVQIARQGGLEPALIDAILRSW